jgi:hypothetical protein
MLRARLGHAGGRVRRESLPERYTEDARSACLLGLRQARDGDDAARPAARQRLARETLGGATTGTCRAARRLFRLRRARGIAPTGRAELATEARLGGVAATTGTCLASASASTSSSERRDAKGLLARARCAGCALPSCVTPLDLLAWARAQRGCATGRTELVRRVQATTSILGSCR